MKEKRTRQAALRWISAIFIVTAVAAVVGAGGRSDIYPGEAWTRFAAPEDAGFDSTALAEAKARFDRMGGAAGLLVRDGSIVVSWGEIDRRFFASSLRKSLLHALLGVAVHENVISLDATIADLGITDVGGLTPAERSATVADLLASRSGIYHPAAFEDAAWTARKPARGTHEPGEAWLYNNWDFNALGTIYEQATGAPLFERFEEEIAAPLGMEDFRPVDTSWFADPEVSEHPAYLLRISTRDLARFGLLYASGGEWEGDQIVPREWVFDGFRRRSDAFSDGTGYGRLWWTAQAGEADIPFASGAPGQRMYVMPEHRIVFVFRPDTYLPGSVPDSQVHTLFLSVLGAMTGRVRAAERMPVSAQPNPREPASPDDIAPYLGSYQSDAIGRVAIEISDGVPLFSTRRARFRIVSGQRGLIVEDLEARLRLDQVEAGAGNATLRPGPSGLEVVLVRGGE